MQQNKLSFLCVLFEEGVVQMNATDGIETTATSCVEFVENECVLCEKEMIPNEKGECEKDENNTICVEFGKEGGCIRCGNGMFLESGLCFRFLFLFFFSNKTKTTEIDRKHVH